MLSFRKTIKKEDIVRIREILLSTQFFNQAPDEIDVAAELAEISIKGGNNVDNYRFIFIEDDSHTIGYACFAKVPCSNTCFEIYWLGVDKSCQGKGAGKILINEVLNEIRQGGGAKAILQTAGREQYIPTQKFYISVGFELEARIKNYYDFGDDCLIYTYSL